MTGCYILKSLWQCVHLVCTGSGWKLWDVSEDSVQSHKSTITVPAGRGGVWTLTGKSDSEKYWMGWAWVTKGALLSFLWWLYSKSGRDLEFVCVCFSAKSVCTKKYYMGMYVHTVPNEIVIFFSCGVLAWLCALAQFTKTHPHLFQLKHKLLV